MLNPEWLQFIYDYLKDKKIEEETILEISLDHIGYVGVFLDEDNKHREFLAKFITYLCFERKKNILEKLGKIINSYDKKTFEETGEKILLYKEVAAIYRDTIII
jgi:hypothetical protein